MSYLKHKPGSIEELMANEASKLNDNAYQDMFKKELDKAGKGIGGMSPKEKKDFFNKIDSKYKAKNEAKVDELTKAQEKLPPALQKAIKDKEMKKEDLGKEDDSVVKKVVGQLKKAVKAHDGQAKDLEKAVSEKVKDGKLDPLSKMGKSKLTGSEIQRYYRDNPKQKVAARDKISRKCFKLGVEAKVSHIVNALISCATRLDLIIRPSGVFFQSPIHLEPIIVLPGISSFRIFSTTSNSIMLSNS